MVTISRAEYECLKAERDELNPETGLASGTGTSEQEETLWGVLGAAGRGTDEPVETHV